MVLSADLAAAVKHRLDTFLTDAVTDPLNLRAVVAKFGALPLVTDMGGCIALRPDGAIVTFAWDEPHAFEVVVDDRLRNVALYQGSLKYPEITALVPSRPADAIDCPHCGGAGTPLLAGNTIPNVICFCGGLGWVPRTLR